jgi:hypothetical protein
MSAQLETFSGTVTLAQPHDLPEGASPRNQNQDFSVGSTFTRQGLEDVFTYEGGSAGPDGGGAAADIPVTGTAWSSPANVLSNTGVFSSANLVSSGSNASSTSAGSNSGGGVAWANPQNVDSSVSFATVSLSSGGTNYSPSQQSGSVSNSASASNTSPAPIYATLSGFASVPATACTLYVNVNVVISSNQGGATFLINYSTNNGATWTAAGGYGASSSATIPIAISGITNLDTIQLQIEATAGCSPTGFANVTGQVTSWYATVAGGSGLTAQTLQAAISGLSIPSGASITGLGISFTADYSGSQPSFQVGLNVGNVTQPETLTTSPMTFTAGGNGSLWGYSSWSQATLSSLIVNFFGSSSATCTINVNKLVVTVYYSYSGNASTDALRVTQFGFSVASTATPQGFVVSVNTNASTEPYTLTAQMVKAGVPVGSPQPIQVPANSTQPIRFGGTGNLFNASWVYSDLNNTSFGVQFTASGSGTTVFLGYVTILAYFVPTQENYNFIGTYEDNFGNIYNVALDSKGDFWLENLSANPGVLTPLFTGPPVNSYASAFVANSRQYLAISDLLQGNYPPQQIIGTAAGQTGWNDRVSQVGPGAPPSFQGTLSAGSTVTITAYSYSGGILTLTAANSLTAGEVIRIIAISSDPLFPLNNQLFNVLGTGLSGTQFEISETAVTGSGTTTATAAAQYTYPIAASPLGITQFPFWNQAQGFQSQLDDILWSSGAGSTNSGPVITVYYLNAFTHQGDEDANLVKYFQQQQFPVYVYVSGTNQPVANGTFLVTSIGIGTPPGGGDQRFYFTYNVASSSYANLGGGSNAQPGQYQLTVATVTTTLPLPGVTANDQITITGDPVASWNETWLVLEALNSGSYAISQTSMAAGTATYSWQISGSTTSPPVVGQLVTVTGTLNGNGIFNVTDAVIASVTGTSSGTFTINGFGNQTFSSETEVAQATTSGTEFLIDPGPLTLGEVASNSPIYGNSGGGFITLVGSSSVVVGTGTRKGTCFFITRNGYYTAPAPTVQFNTADNTNYILVSNIPIGPPNVIARAIVFTEAGQEGQPGASYYFIAVPQQFVFNGVTYLSSSTVINDNVTTTAKFTFPDSVLLNAEEIDIQGNDLFALEELGDSAWCAQYAGRSVWGRVRNKVPNFVNMSFDGGYNPNPGGNILPLGWGLNAATAPIGIPTLLVSPVFGNSYYINNNTGSTKTQLGMITQSAYQDYNNVAILNPGTEPVAYSVRVTVRTPSSATGGALVIDLTDFNSSTGYGQTYGSYVLPTSSMTSSMETYSGVLLATPLASIPPGLLLRVWAQNLPNGADIEIDRIEVYPTLAPTNLTDLTISYKNDLESFDQDTGNATTTTVNAQPANGGFEMNGLFYVLKESSLGYISDTPNQEPTAWNPFKQVSPIAGACGINAWDASKKWAIMANQNGLFLFNGGEPTQIELDIPDIWAAINWSNAQGLVVRNDTANNRFFIACPMATPNQWCPSFEENDGTGGNNVILYINYDGIGNIESLMASEPLHVTIMGQLAVHDLRMKYSLWSIPTPYMAICKRSELFSEMLFCNGIGSSKIYSLGSYQAGADDGVPFPSSYCTYGFVDQKKAKENPVFGLHNKRYVYWDFLISGSGDINSGTLSITFFQNVLQAPYPFSVPGGVTLSDPAANDIEGPLDEFAQRLFVEISTFGVGCYFNISRMTLVAQADAWSPLRGF